MTKTNKTTKYYHYLDCGLDYIYLANGYKKIKDPILGECVAIRDVEGLHKIIVKAIVKHAPVIRGQEIRFIRAFLKLSQTQMGVLFKNDLRTIQRWEEEKRNESIPTTAENFIRLFVLAHLNNHEVVHKACDMLKQVREDVRSTTKKDAEPNKFFNELALSDTNQGWKAA
jgi:DNA-binding transcriptional regulator YiaG